MKVSPVKLKYDGTRLTLCQRHRNGNAGAKLPSTQELSSMKLVHHERLERICQRVYPGEPSEPRVHIWTGNGISSIDHDSQYQNTRYG